MKRFFAPEVVQTSNLDCGPAALKCLLEGFGTHVGYDRLREACQTSLDGTSIDTIESVATQLGLEAEQVMLPVDHVLLAESKALPAVVVVTLPTGLTHFVVVWRRHGKAIQIMDPAIGRRWVGSAQFVREIFTHSMLVEAGAWREFAASEDFQCALRARLKRVGASASEIQRLTAPALASESWEAIAALDAAVRVIAVLRAGGGVNRREGVRVLTRLSDNPASIPDSYWPVRPGGPPDENGQAHLLMRGAVLVRVRGKKTSPVQEPLTAELAAAVGQKPLRPGWELLRFVRQGGASSLAMLAVALAMAAGGATVEALLFRGLFDIAGELHLTGQRLGAMAAILFFSLALLLLELPTFASAARLGRQLENRLRVAFLSKIPKLGDRYFQSRLTSDMAERSHATHRLRHLPDLMRQLTRSVFELCATAAGIIWLEPSSAPIVLLILGACLLPAFASQSLLAERDLRARSHAAGLTRFYLDAMLGLIAIRAHGAERSLRREHEKLLGEWGNAALRLQKAVVSIEAAQFIASFGLVAWLVLSHPFHGADIGRALLVLYWALNLPVLGQDIGALARQYPSYRNLTLRLLEPLGAPEEPVAAGKQSRELQKHASPTSLQFRNVSVAVSGHRILEDINFEIEAGSHAAIVGRSGAGKSSLAGVLLGWLKPSTGEVLVNGLPLNWEQLRLSTAWVDPAIQLWNRSLFSNLAYGSEDGSNDVGRAIDGALLRSVLESLPDGLQTKLGEGGALVSGGEGQRVRLGRAMLRGRSSLVILDEPFRGLDREKRHELLRRARSYWRGCTLLCITHDIDETQEFDRVLVIERGRVIEDGTPAHISASPESKYSQLLEAEAQVRSGLWSSRVWRRIHMHSGRIVEKVPEPFAEKQRETEVA